MYSKHNSGDFSGLVRAMRWIMGMTALMSCFMFQPSRAADGAEGVPASANTAKISDPELLSWVGEWDGFSKDGEDTNYMELEWKLDRNERWLSGRMRIWDNAEKENLLSDETVYIRPCDTAGIYKGFFLGQDCVIRVGRAVVNDKVWEWTWQYDNGAQERSKMVYFGQGKMFYEGSLVDRNGRLVRKIDYDLTRPVVLSIGSRR